MISLLFGALLAIAPVDPAKLVHDEIAKVLTAGARQKLAAIGRSMQPSAGLPAIANSIRMAFPAAKLDEEQLRYLTVFVLHEASLETRRQIESLQGQLQSAGQQKKTIRPNTLAEANLRAATDREKSIEKLASSATVLSNLANMRHEMLKAVAQNLRG